MKLKINQTLIKKLKKGNDCPAQIKEMLWPTVVTKVAATDSQLKGLVFEQEALDMDPVYGPPLLKMGGVPVDYIRIREQAKRFKEEIVPQYELEIKPENVQLYIEHQYNADVILHGTLDFVSPIKDDVLGKMPIAIHDLKMTGSIYKQFGDYSWAFPYNIDHTQAHMYKFLFKAEHKYTLPFYYWVFDYSPDKNLKIFRKETTSIDSLELEESIRMSVEKLNEYDRNGWVESASPENCRYCPLKETCKSFDTKQKIEIL